jgi:putative membrane-bound dehydrogenase-like protein
MVNSRCLFCLSFPTVFLCLISWSIEKSIAETEPVAQNGGPLSPKEEQATFHIAKGLTIELVASEPDVVDPVAMAFDEDGRLYVVEMPGYPNEGVATGKISSGRIKVFENKDGTYPKSTTFVEGLRLPTSVMPYRGGILVADAPNLLYLKKKPDGTLQKDILYSGFALENIQQLLNGLQWGLDNWVYGIAGGNGGTIQSEQDKKLPSVTLRGRGIRFHPDEPASLEPISSTGQFGLTADNYQRWFTNTNNQHLRHIVLPDHYLHRNPYLAVSAVAHDIPDHGAACKVFRISPFEGWRVERTRRRKSEDADAKKYPSTELVPGGYITSACSPLVYTGGLFPKDYESNVFECDPANNLIHRDVLVPHGATFVAKRGSENEEFLASTDTWFRPVCLTIGPEGAVYVLDFYREVIETPLSLPEDIKQKLNLQSRSRGRIWRIRPENSVASTTAPLGKASAEELVHELGSPNSWRRLTAQRLLVERQDKEAIKSLENMAQSCLFAPVRAHALWTLQGLKAMNLTLIEKALHDVEPGVREQALRLAEPYLADSESLRKKVASLADDESARVRFQLAFTLGQAQAPALAHALAAILRRDSADSWTQTAVLSSAARQAPDLLETLTQDKEFTRALTGTNRDVFVRLAAMVGAQNNQVQLARVLNLLKGKKEDDARWQEAVLEGIGQGIQSSQGSLRALWEQPPAALAEAVKSLLPVFHDALGRAQDVSRTPEERVSALRLVGFGPFPDAKAMAEFLEPKTPVEIQRAAIRALSKMDHPKVADLLLEPWATYGPQSRREVAEALFANPQRLRQLLKAMETKKVMAAHLEPARLDFLRNHRDPDIRRQAQSVLAGQIKPDRKNIIEMNQDALKLQGDMAKGKGVFKKNCSTCHRLENVGVEVGPDLLSALRNKTPETLLIDILDPSREVDPRYLNYTVTTKAGKTLTGMIAAETASSITLRRAEKEEDTILRSQIDEIAASTKSLMPEDLEKVLSKQDLADVIRYLSHVLDEPAKPPSYQDKSNLLFYMDGGKSVPVRSAADWSKRRADIVENMQLVMGPLPDAKRKVDLAMQVEETTELPKVIRKRITFAVEKDDRVSAYLLIPKQAKKKVPAILCLHQTTTLGKGEPAGVGGKENLQYALELAQRGYITLAPDYPYFGDYKVDPYQRGYVSATMKGIWNHMRAVDLLQSLEEVDGKRIGCIGHSLGGHNSLFVSVFDERIKVIVTSCGFTSFPRYYQGDLTGWCHKGYMPRIEDVYKKDSKKMPFDFTEVLAALAPRAVFINAPIHDTNFEVTGVKDCVRAALPAYELFKSTEMIDVVYPNAEHDFPPKVRERAYQFIDKHLLDR